MLGVILVVAGGLALLWTRVEQPDSDLLVSVRAAADDFPGCACSSPRALTVLVVSTFFGSYLPGLSTVSEMLLAGLRAPIDGSAPVPVLFTLIITIFYEPVLWLFGIASVAMLARQGTINFRERFFIVWLLVALVAAFFLDSPEYALWITLPLAGLASSLVVDILATDEHPFLEVPAWGKPLLALGIVALLFIFTIHFQTVIRPFINVPGGSFELLTIDSYSGAWMAIAVALMLLSFFMVSGLWGRRTALRSLGTRFAHFCAGYVARRGLERFCPQCVECH